METHKKIRVLNYSTHDEDCGIGKYQEDFVRVFAEQGDIESDFYETSPNVVKTLQGAELAAELSKLEETLKSYDILHIQHEFGFYHGDGEGISYITNIARKLNKKLVITIHTAPSLVYRPVIRGGRSVRAHLGYYRQLARMREVLDKRLAPLRDADLIVTLNPHTTQELTRIVGVDANKIHQTVIPTETTNPSAADRSVLRQVMDAKKDDTILATIGFLSDKKGVDAAVKSLSFLPKNYKLAILGGLNPVSGNPEVYERLCDLIVNLGLQDRVYISGYVQDDVKLDQLVSGVDIALYPYDPAYYKLASSAALNTALNNEVPVVAYPAESFKEVTKSVPGTISVTASPNYYELVRCIREIDLKHQAAAAAQYRQLNDISVISKTLTKLYEDLLTT